MLSLDDVVVLAHIQISSDTIFLIWQKAIVESFQSRPLVACPPNVIERSFEETKESIVDFCSRVGSLSPAKVQSEVQGALLLGLVDTRIGRYSIMHDTSVYLNGYSHLKTIELAYKYVNPVHIRDQFT